MGPFGTAPYLTKVRHIGSWYADDAWFVSPSYPWVKRGGGHNYGSDSGVFAFGNSNGPVGSGNTFRLILTPEGST